MKKIRPIVIGALSAAAVTAALGTGIASADSGTVKPSPAQDYVITYQGVTRTVTVQHIKTGVNTYNVRINDNGKRYLLVCARETATVSYCGEYNK